MAEVVSKYADFAIVSNDNPRFEDPKVIAKDIVSRLTCKHKVVLNRSQATEFALSLASCGDIVAILGKGAERYQEIKGKKVPYSDLEVVSRLLNVT
jgi:UDP-N-acetylmuramoyl-L-alanyl-D-glutamate--2,6-diaminopimelate ligase